MSTERTRIMQEYQAMPAQDKPRHTPGPWIRDGLTVYALHHNGDYRRGVPVMVNRFRASVDSCVNQGGTEAEAEANARLIAASPALLEACKAALAHVEDETVERLGGSECTLCNTFRAKLRAAIAAAEQEA